MGNKPKTNAELQKEIEILKTELAKIKWLATGDLVYLPGPAELMVIAYIASRALKKDFSGLGSLEDFIKDRMELRRLPITREEPRMIDYLTAGTHDKYKAKAHSIAKTVTEAWLLALPGLQLGGLGKDMLIDFIKEAIESILRDEG